MMADHAKQVVWEYFTTKHDDATDSVRDRLGGILAAINDFVGAPVTTGFSATLTDAAPSKKS